MEQIGKNIWGFETEKIIRFVRTFSRPHRRTKLPFAGFENHAKQN